MRILIVISSLFVVACQTPAPQAQLPKAKPLVIAHRGASGHLPEHTIPAYELAIQSYADYIEPDLVITKDGVLVVRHENELSDTTDVATKYPKRKTKKTIDGQAVTGWFSEDFTLKEIKTLRTKQRFPFRDQSQNGKHSIPTFEEVLKLVSQTRSPTGEAVGVYPELKHPAYFRGLNLPLEEKVIGLLHQYGYKTKKDLAIIQSFEPESLQRLRKLTDLKLVQLTWQGELTKEDLVKIASYADGIGPNKRQILPETTDGKLGQPTQLVKWAKEAKLLVHPYTFRSDLSLLHSEYENDPQKEYQKFFEMGVDGVFSDFPEDAAKAKTSL